MTAAERFLLIEYLGMIGEIDESSASPATVDEQFEDWYRLRASGVPWGEVLQVAPGGGRAGATADDKAVTVTTMAKRARDPAKPPREGPPCKRCGRPTPPRSNWPRATAVFRLAEQYKSQQHHLCRRCFRKQRPNDHRLYTKHPRR